TLGFLIYTIYLQDRTTNLLVMENKFRMMPFFELKCEKDYLFTLIAKNNIAYDIKLKLIGENIFDISHRFIESSQTDIIGTEVNFQSLRLKTLISNFPEKVTPKDKKIEFIKVVFTDYNRREYYQKIYFINDWLHISRPFEVKKSNRFLPSIFGK